MGAANVEYIRLLHRVVVFFIALWYVSISIQAFLASVSVLRGLETKDMGITVHESTLIVDYAGEGAITDSPLVQNVLKGSTTLRNDSIYLLTNSTHSFTSCTASDDFDTTVYGDTFMRFLYNSLQKHAVDDLAFIRRIRDTMRMYFLTRQKSKITESVLVSALISTQDFQVVQQYQSGAALLVTVAPINDMQAADVNHSFAIAFNYPYESEPHFTSSELLTTDSENYWVFKNFPPPNSIDTVKEVRTAYRFGSYIDDSIAQSNIETVVWNLPKDPVSELRNWEWHSSASLRDSWAWTHSIHGIFAVIILFDLSVLFFVVYHRFRAGSFWVGDAFATISNSLLYRGVLIFASNHLNGYWTLTEFCLAIGNELGDRRSIHYRPELVHADLLTFFLNISSVLSYVFRERIDPVVAFAAFECSFTYRVELVDASATLRTIIVDFAETDYWSGLITVSPFLAKLSPMKFWTVHGIETDRKVVVICTVIAMFATMVWLVVYMCARKYFRRVQSKRGGKAKMYAAERKSMNSEVKQLTSFETATGSALSKRYGVISGYDNYLVQDNKIYASIDAVYGNGYLIANNKFLVATEDMLSLLVMKITRVRFTNIYVYSILEDGGVKQTAELVYPTTISWGDLAHLGVAKLA
ncbi:hypothetical protein L914_15581 [Phytophthora nicotianae]|uniref:Transmembrane protein n=2 Tax=Phytophthora nicotianae TaxID=4792 RepID=V9EFL0_PHYNI|nr:hypothetical protein F443_16177 [Phytophthora nicotianae P1569]ETM38029.1 hypothetical protein L914_15581 [Phytophthora nicotianae]